MDVTSIAPQAVAKMIENGTRCFIIDVRTPMEYAAIHAAGTENMPLDTLDPKAATPTEDEKLFVICKSGSRSKKACEQLIAAGITTATLIEGGTDAWVAAGLPVVKGKQVMSLERQTRIAAGAMVLIGAILGWLVHPGFYGLSAFVGAGLVFAGITDTCGMGMMIAKMPWNQVKDLSPCAKGACAVKH